MPPRNFQGIAILWTIPESDCLSIFYLSVKDSTGALDSRLIMRSPMASVNPLLYSPAHLPSAFGLTAISFDDLLTLRLR